MNRVSSHNVGYTIVETMIFLAVSSSLFIVAMVLVNGQQSKTQFSTMVREFDSKLLGVISNVSTGYYNNAGKFRCRNVSGIPVIDTITLPPQGQNADCIFVGQYIRHASNVVSFTSHAGLRLNPVDGKQVISLAQANPRPIPPADDITLLSGSTVSMRIGATTVDEIAITTTFGSYTPDNLSSGSNRVELHAYSGSTKVAVPQEGIIICLISGSQVGIIVLNTGSTNLTFGNSCP